MWLAQAHRNPPPETDNDWRERWAVDAERYGQSPPPVTYLDPDDLVRAEPSEIVEVNRKTTRRALTGSLELLEAMA